MGFIKHALVGKRPQIPDARETADHQRRYDQLALMDAIRASQIGQTTPWGSIRYEGDPGSANRRQIVELDPRDQAILDQRRQASLALSQLLAPAIGRLGARFGMGEGWQQSNTTPATSGDRLAAILGGNGPMEAPRGRDMAHRRGMHQGGLSGGLGALLARAQPRQMR